MGLLEPGALKIDFLMNFHDMWWNSVAEQATQTCHVLPIRI